MTKHELKAKPAVAGVRTRQQPKNPQTKKNNVSAQTKKRPTSSVPVKANVKKSAANIKKSSAKTKAVTKPRTPVKIAVREVKPNIHTVKAVTVIPMPVTIIAVAVICTILFMIIVFSFVNINEYTIYNDRLETQIASLEKEYKELSLSLERKNNLQEIERYAKEQLGMVKLDQLTKEYISITNEDKIEVMNNTKSAQDILSSFFESITKNFRSIVEYIE